MLCPASIGVPHRGPASIGVPHRGRRGLLGLRGQQNVSGGLRQRLGAALGGGMGRATLSQIWESLRAISSTDEGVVTP